MESKTIHFFREIAKIPRESGNESQIAKYLCEFAKKRNLYYECDIYNNVFIRKKTSDTEPIILQAHTDMICEKLSEKDFNFKTDEIELIEQDGYLKANGTTLGADNGIGVAQILSVLDSDTPCNIEAVFTVSEETTMIGASKFDTSKLKGKKLLNLDGFEENTIIIGSACFYDIILNTNYVFKENEDMHEYEINLSGMPGGHSGFEIDKNCGNSIIELAKLLNEINDIKIISFSGGSKFNVIPSTAQAKFYTSLSLQEIQNICCKIQRRLKKEYPQIKIVTQKERSKGKSLNNNYSKVFLKSIIQFPHGVVNKNIKQEVTTSINLGIVDLEKQEFKVGMRSSKNVEEEQCLKILENYSNNYDMKLTVLDSQAGFDSNENCELIQGLLKAHPKELFKESPNLKSVHITVEVGLFKERIKDLQVAIISPNIQGAHTPKECVEIASIKKTDKWILDFLGGET